MKITHLAIALGVALASYIGYRRFTSSAAQRAVDKYADNYGKGTEPSPPPMTWNGTSWVPLPPVAPSQNTATLQMPPPPAPPPSPVGGATMSTAAWSAVAASTAPVPRVGTVGLLPVELATLLNFNPPA